MKVLKHEEDKSNSYSVLIDTGKLNVWIDVDVYEDDIRVNWNQYIFDLTNSKDIAIKKFQDSADNFSDCSSLAIHYLENNNLLPII